VNNKEVMTGGVEVVNIRQGVYTAADLCKRWLDNKSSATEIVNLEHVRVVRNVSHSLTLLFNSYRIFKVFTIIQIDLQGIELVL
jgi:hypothetical protein